jgi:hypothetical protein
MPPISAADHYRRRAGELRSLAADGRPWDALRAELVQLAQRYDRLAAEVESRPSPAKISATFPGGGPEAGPLPLKNARSSAQRAYAE